MESTPRKLVASATLKWPQFQKEFGTLISMSCSIWKCNIKKNQLLQLSLLDMDAKNIQKL
jgi:hypothetical protein